jgi:hypothetical protein
MLDDLRRIQARDDLKPAQHKNRIVMILAQNIGAVLGLGPEPGGRLRVVPDKSDYAAFGALTKAHSAETVWATACDIVGKLRQNGEPREASCQCTRQRQQH